MKVRDYGYLDADNRIVYAEDFAEIDGVIYTSPKAEHRARETPPKLPIDSTKPEKDGAYFVSTEYGDLVDGRIVRRYDERPIVAPPPRTFSKLKLYAVLSAANLWDALKAWLEAQTYEGMNAWEAFSLAQELTEDHPMFAKWFSAAKTALDVDDATAEELLARCVKEGY